VEYDVGLGTVLLTGQPLDFAFETGQPAAQILFNAVPYVTAFTPVGDVPWLSVSPLDGTIEPDDSTDLEIVVDATGLVPGDYEAIVLIRTNDPHNPRLRVMVSVVVTEVAAPV